MNLFALHFYRAAIPLLASLLLIGCDQLNLNPNKPKSQGNRPDLDCIIANDFYAIHFSAYIQPPKGEPLADPKAAFTPYCQKIPHPGKMYFTADLIDRDVRSVPIAIRLIEVEKTGQKSPDDFHELRTVAEIPAKLYPRGAVEAQAEIDKKGDYLLYLLIGEAIEEDDKFRVPLEVGVDPNAIPPLTLALVGGGIVLLMGLAIFFYRVRVANSSKNSDHSA
jgi:hypothetical protein